MKAIKTNLIRRPRFDKLTNAQKRVAICKDVIARMDLNLLTEVHGLVIKNRHQFAQIAKSPREAINKKECEVCAKGALICSWIGNFNQFSFSEFIGIPHGDSMLGAPPELTEIFGYEMLDNIEAAYEGRTYSFHRSQHSQKYAEKFAKKKYLHGFGRKCGDLREIMNYIIENKGEFPLLA